MFFQIIDDWCKKQENKSRGIQPGVETIAQQIVASWQAGHNLELGKGNKAGFGGLMRAEHAKALFLASERDIGAISDAASGATNTASTHYATSSCWSSCN